jgi:hypothetical protein
MLWVWKAQLLPRRWRPLVPLPRRWLPGSAGRPIRARRARIRCRIPRTRCGSRRTAWLDALTEAARLEARVAALKVHAAAGFASAEAALAAPEASAKERSVLQMSVTAEVAGALTVSEGVGGTVSGGIRQAEQGPAVDAGRSAGGNAVVAATGASCVTKRGAGSGGCCGFGGAFPGIRTCRTLLGVARPGADTGEVRAKARYWRERHHPGQHRNPPPQQCEGPAAGVRPGPDGMAWLSAYLPADQAAGIWNRTTARRPLPARPRQKPAP